MLQNTNPEIRYEIQNYTITRSKKEDCCVTEFSSFKIGYNSDDATFNIKRKNDKKRRLLISLHILETMWLIIFDVMIFISDDRFNSYVKLHYIIWFHLTKSESTVELWRKHIWHHFINITSTGSKLLDIYVREINGLKEGHHYFIRFKLCRTACITNDLEQWIHFLKSFQNIKTCTILTSNKNFRTKNVNIFL